MTESLRDKLRRLRREDGRGAPTPPPTPSSTRPDAAEPAAESSLAPLKASDPTPTPGDAAPSFDALAASLARRGERLGKHLERRAEVRALRGTGTSRAATDAAPSPSLANSSGLDVPATTGAPRSLERCARTGVLARTMELAREHAHGAWKLEEALAADAQTLALLAKDAAIAEHALSDALFLDTETTGLSGGAGTYVFLVGLGSFARGGFEVWQGFLPDPSEEKALLAEAAERIARAPLLVTFFGKSFDRHRLEDKMRLHGITPPFAGKPHLDLYHPLRRLYGKALPDARLKTMEHALCGVRRPNDLPGSFAPAAWFDFLAERPHRLEGVFAHNHDDVLSLVTLAAHAGRVRESGAVRPCELEHEPALRALGVARLLAERREYSEAHALLTPMRERATTNPLEPLHRSMELACVALEIQLGRLDTARRALEVLLVARLDAASALVHVQLLGAELRARRTPSPDEFARLASFLEREAVGADHARLARGLRGLMRAPRRRHGAG